MWHPARYTAPLVDHKICCKNVDSFSLLLSNGGTGSPSCQLPVSVGGHDLPCGSNRACGESSVKAAVDCTLTPRCIMNFRARFQSILLCHTSYEKYVPTAVACCGMPRRILHLVYISKRDSLISCSCCAVLCCAMIRCASTKRHPDDRPQRASAFGHP